VTLAEQLITRVIAAVPRRRRVTLETLERCFVELVPQLAMRVSRRAELLSLLEEMRDAGLLRFPRDLRCYDRVSTPPLPRWIEFPRRTAGPTATERAAAVAWHPALEFMQQLRGVTEDELRLALAVQRYLARPQDGWMTVRERSLRLLGDEKQLEGLVRGRLFGDERLGLEILRCIPVAMPFVYRDHEHGSDALIIENKDTYFSANEAVGEGSPIRWVIFGAGNVITSAVHSLALLTPKPRAVWYFGDIDKRGLNILAAVMSASRSMSEAPVVSPADEMYRRLVDNAVTLDVSLRGNACTPNEAASLALLMPPTIRTPVETLLARGGRWPQECVTAADLVELLSAPCAEST
jgi:hypothetical protein